MEIKHTHPPHVSEEARKGALRDRHRLCLAQLRERRKNASDVKRQSA